jgi:hypothetical protein
METKTYLSDGEQLRTTRLAAASFVVAPVVTIGFWIAGGEAGYESPLFVWTHVSTLLAGILLATGATTSLYAIGLRRLGVAGLVGTAFAWLGVGASTLWVPIAWQASVFAQTGASSLGTYTALFSPLGSGYFVSVMFLYALAVAGIAGGLARAGAVHRAVAGLGALGGVVAGVWMLYTLLAVFTEPVTGVTVALTVLQWTVVLPLGVSLLRRGGGTDVSEDSNPETPLVGDD